MKLWLPLLLALAWCGDAAAQSTYLGDYVLGDTVRCPWSTYKPSTGDSVARATAGTVTVYADNGAGNGFNTTESATGVTDTSGFDSKTGEHQAVVVASSGNGYAAGKDYAIMVQSSTITDTGTVTFSAWPCTFSIENRSATRSVIVARGAMVTGSTTTVVQLATGTLPATSHIWQGMSIHNVTKNEDATICDSTDGGASNDTLSVAGFVTTPGATDSYEIRRTGIAATCIPMVAGSGLPYVNASTGAVVVERIGQSGSTAPTISDKAGSNFNTSWDNGNATFSGTVGNWYAATISADTHIGTPTSLGSGATLAANFQDANGIAHTGTCDGSSTTTVCNDTVLTEADDFWNHWTEIIVAGEPPRCVRDFANATHRLTFSPALPSTAASKAFVLRASSQCRSFP